MLQNILLVTHCIPLQAGKMVKIAIAQFYTRVGL